MADEKLSELPVISDPVQTTDQLYVVRAGVSYQMTVDQILAILPPSSAVWGSISGNINDQADLQAEFDAKADNGLIIASGLTMSTGYVLGRVTAGAGAIEQIPINGTGAVVFDNGPGIDSPSLSGSPTAPTATPGDNSTLLATTAFVAAAVTAGGSGFVTTSQASPQTIGSTGNRLTKLWATDITVTNAIAGSITGNAATVTGATLTTALTVNGGTLTLTANAANTSVLTIGAGAVSVSGSNTGDQTNITGNAGTATALQTARAINGVNFDGTAPITVTAAAGTLTGTTLASGVVTSSLTTVGALASGSLATGFVVGGVTMTLGSDAANDIYYRNSSGVLTRLANGTTGQFLAATTGSAPSWGTPSGSGTVTHTGSLTSNAVVLGNGTADIKVVAGITTDGTSVLILGVNTTTLGKVKMFGNTSGDVTIQPNAVAGTGIVLTLPATTDTLVGKTTTDTLTNKTLTSPVVNGLTSSGSTSIDFSGNSGTFKTTTGATTLGSTATVNGIDVRNPITPTLQNNTYSTVLADAGLGITHNSGSAHTWTIDGSVSYAVGTTLTFFNNGTGVVTIAITTDTMQLAGTASGGSRTLTGPNALATAYKYASGLWVISGVGLT